jgi:hypothetical protein
MKKENNELVKLHYREGAERDLYYRNWTDITREFDAHDSMIHVAVYCSYTKSIETGALQLWNDGRVMMNRLETTGYSIFEIELGELNKEYYILKKLPMEYHEAVFWNKGEKVYLLHLQTGLTEEAVIHEWTDHGNYGEFTVITLEGVKKLQASGYGEEYVFLKP